jgi:hypothetical protein
MKTRKIVKLFLTTIMMLWGSHGFAMGLGFTLGQSSEKWRDNDNLLAPDADHDVSSTGFMLDTIVAKRKTFGYRFAYLDEENKSTSNGYDNYKGVATTHDFAFAVFANNLVRVWVGPRLKVVFYDDVVIGGSKTSANITGVLWGPIVGVNLHLGHVVSLSFSLAQLRGNYSDSGLFSSSCSFSTTCSVDSDSNTTSFNVSFVFRVGGDRY